MIEYRIVRINKNWNQCLICQTNIPKNVGTSEYWNIGTLECWNVGTTKQLLV